MQGRNRNLARVHSLRQSSALVIGEEEDLALPNGAAECTAKLVLAKCAARGGEIVASIEIRVAQKLECVTMKFVGTRFGNDVDLPSAAPSVLRVKIVREDAELRNRVEVRNDHGPRIDVLLGVASVHYERIRELPLSADRDRAGIETAGGRQRAHADVLLGVGSKRCRGNNTRLESK